MCVCVCVCVCVCMIREFIYFAPNPSQRDTFWMTQRGKPFPQVAEAIEVTLNAYKEREKKIKDLKVRTKM